MARARYIYLVEYNDCGQDRPHKAFTVKHELVAWLGRHEQQPYLDDYTVYRLPDGGYGNDPVVMPIPELLAS